MEISLLRTGLAVYRTGSLTKAARELGISQPAVTGQLRTLESKLQQRLFLRVHQGAVPTEAAHELFRETAGALDSLEVALRRRLEPRELTDRAVRLAGPPEVIAARVLPAVSELVRAGLRLQISFGSTDDLVAGLADGVYDMAVVVRQPRRAGIVSCPLMDEEFVLVGTPDVAEHVLAEEIAVYGSAVLSSIPFISYAGNLPIISHYWLTIFGQQPDVAAQVTVPDLNAVLVAVRSGAGISVLPSYLCADEIAKGTVRVLYNVAVPPLNTLFVATRATRDAEHVGLARLKEHLLSKSRQWQ